MLSKIRSASRGFYFPSWSIPIALLLLTVLTYGLRALSLGFYWDDWVYQWVFHRFGAAGIAAAFSGDRPFLSFIYTLSLSVFGSASQGWQIFGLLARWLCGAGLWWMLAQAWPRHADKAAWAAFLFTVYPGFTQQWISVIYAQAFFLFAAPFFSIGITLWLARSRSRLRQGQVALGTALALVLSAFTMFSTEYFFGLELLRPILLWIVFNRAAGEKPLANRPAFLRQARQTAAWWAPYLALMLLFVLWRGVIHPFSGHDLTTLQAVEREPLRAIWNLGLNILQDVLVASLAAWGQPLQTLEGFISNGVSGGLKLLAVILITGLCAAAFLAWLRACRTKKTTQENQLEPEPAAEGWASQAIVVGVLAILAAGWPTWITGLAMRMGFPLDRYALALSVGVCLLLAGAIDWLGKNRAGKIAVLALLTGLAAGFHFNNALAYHAEWDMTRDFFWQLTWRAPGIRPGTLFASDSMAFRFNEDDSLTAPLNWTYDPGGRSGQMQYMLYDLLVRRESLPSLKPGKTIMHGFRGADFEGSTSRVLIFSYDPPGCLRILDPLYDADLYRLPDRLIQTTQYSNPRALILNQDPPAALPASIFGDEPKHRWCYYFEKAELARQSGDWKAISRLGQESIGRGYRPEDASEYLPFIEGYARAYRPEDAYQLSLSTRNEAPAARPAICSVWRRVTQDVPGLREAYLEKVNYSFGCQIP